MPRQSPFLSFQVNTQESAVFVDAPSVEGRGFTSIITSNLAGLRERMSGMANQEFLTPSGGLDSHFFESDDYFDRSPMATDATDDVGVAQRCITYKTDEDIKYAPEPNITRGKPGLSKRVHLHS